MALKTGYFDLKQSSSNVQKEYTHNIGKQFYHKLNCKEAFGILKQAESTLAN